MNISSTPYLRLTRILVLCIAASSLGACTKKNARPSPTLKDAATDAAGAIQDAGRDAADAAKPTAADAGPDAAKVLNAGMDAGAADAAVPFDAAVVPLPPPPVRAVDSDGDGFPDNMDPAPNDPNVPGDFSTPEAILADSRVKAALLATRNAGYPIVAAVGKNVPNVSGYYARPDRSGMLVASSDGAMIGNLLFGYYSRLDQFSDLTIDFFLSSYDLGIWQGSGISVGSMLRGNGQTVTIYLRETVHCTRDTTPLDFSDIDIATFTVDRTTGNWINRRDIFINVASQGPVNGNCKATFGANAVTSGWTVAQTPLTTRVGVGQLQYMCVDQNKGYVTTETWTEASGADCSCVNASSISCTDQ